MDLNTDTLWDMVKVIQYIPVLDVVTVTNMKESCILKNISGAVNENSVTYSYCTVINNKHILQLLALFYQIYIKEHGAF